MNASFTARYACVLGISAVLAGVSLRDRVGGKTVQLFCVRVLHLFLIAVSTTHAIVFPDAPRALDIAVLALLIATILHWPLMRNECILSFAEKKLMDPGYVMGTDPWREVYLEDLVGRRHRMTAYRVFVALCIVNFAVIAYRLFRR